MTTLVSWNIDYNRRPWRELVDMDVDVALLQETCAVPPHVAGSVAIGPPGFEDADVFDSRLWHSDRYKKYFQRRRWPRIAKLSDRVTVEWFTPVLSVTDPLPENAVRVSDINSIAIARVIPRDDVQEPFIVVSMYAGWIAPHPVTGGRWRHATPDVSAHRIISDLSAFIRDTDRLPHRIVAAGDLNMDYGGWNPRRPFLSKRERTVWDRMEALRLEYLGPQYPNGRQAEPRPSHLPANTRNVPTFRRKGSSPTTARLQLDHVFASHGFHETVRTEALNGVAEWGSSDHCRIRIEVDS